MEENVFRAWYNDITNFIKATINDPDKKIVIIALSRKMPRLLSWIKENFLSEKEAEEFNALLSNPQCIYTTEHAIPFVFAENGMTNAEVLVLDDMFVTGETMQGVSDEIYALTKRRPYYLGFYTYAKDQKKREEGITLFGTNISTVLPKQLNKIGEAREMMRSFSRMIEESQMPIDIEFPILHIKSRNFESSVSERVIAELRSRQPEARYFRNDVNGQIRDFTQLIESDINRLFNNDFAKLRLFPHKEDARLVCYAPNILSDSQVMNPFLFANEKYRRLWKNLLDTNTMPDPVKDQYDHIIDDEDQLRHKLSMRLHKSLVVFANYMFSLSMMIRQKHDYAEALPDSKYQVELRKEDLALLIGPHLADRYITNINDLYRDSITSDSLRQEINLPDLLANDNVMAEYSFLSTSAIFKANTAEEAIHGIFTAAYSVCANFKEKNEFSIKGVYVLESFQSLYNKPSVHLQGLNGEMEVNKSIDHLIDQGFVVPTYERVKNENNTLYWRRFFRATHTSPLLAPQPALQHSSPQPAE